MLRDYQQFPTTDGNGCPPTAQTSGLARTYRRGKLMTARSTLTHRTEEAPHRRRKNSKSGAVTDKIFEKKKKTLKKAPVAGHDREDIGFGWPGPPRSASEQSGGGH